MKILGICIVGPNEKYLLKTTECFERLCDDILLVQDPREWGKYQNLIKEDALKEAAKYNPDWILALDADEELLCSREQLESLTKSDEISYRFYFVQKWNDEEHVNENLNFFDVRFFKWMPELGVKYQNTPLHCGMAPFWAYQYAWDAPHMVIHRGLMNPEDRRRKIERYEKYDPKMVYCSPDYYNALKSKDEGTPYDQEETRKKVEEAVRKNGIRVRPPIEIPKKMITHRIKNNFDGRELNGIPEDKCIDYTNQGDGKQWVCLGPEDEGGPKPTVRFAQRKISPFEIDELIRKGAQAFWVRRTHKYEDGKLVEDGFTFDCPKNIIHDTLAQPYMELIGEIRVAKPLPVEEVPVVDDPLECLVCGFVAKNDSGLRLHGRKHK